MLIDGTHKHTDIGNATNSCFDSIFFNNSISNINIKWIKERG